MPALTFYLNDIEKRQFQKYAEARKITPTKLVSLIIRAWVQARMAFQEEEDEEG